MWQSGHRQFVVCVDGVVEHGVGDAQVVGVCSSVGEEDGILSVNEGCGVVQDDLPVCMVLAVATFSTESPVLEGVGMCVVLLGTWNEDVECKGMRVCVDQWLEWGTGFTCNGCMKCSGELLDEGGLKDVQLIVKR